MQYVPVVAGSGVGVLRGLPEAAEPWIVLGEATRPRRSLAPLYARRLARYEALLEQLNRGNEQHMTKK